MSEEEGEFFRIGLFETREYLVGSIIIAALTERVGEFELVPSFGRAMNFLRISLGEAFQACLAASAFPRFSSHSAIRSSTSSSARSCPESFSGELTKRRAWEIVSS